LYPLICNIKIFSRNSIGKSCGSIVSVNAVERHPKKASLPPLYASLSPEKNI
jgi:hypothetical protein